MNRILITVFASALLLAGCGQEMKSGIEKANFDNKVRPQDDFYLYTNGTWLEKTEIPADKSNYGAFTELYEESQKNLRKIIEASAQKKDKVAGSDEQKIGDFYLSYMDSSRLDEMGITPLQPYLAEINAVNDRSGLVKLAARFQQNGTQTPFGFYINQDLKNSEQYIGYLTQSGLGLPDRDYYFNEGEKFDEFRAKYKEYVLNLLELAGVDDAEAKSARIYEMEENLAKSHWTRVENRDRDKTYNKFTIKELDALTPQFSWSEYVAAAGMPDAEALIVRQPTYFEGMNEAFKKYTVEDWKTYYSYKLITGSASLLSKEFVDLKFNFYGKTLRGIEQNEPRWKRAVNAIDGVLGEMVGKIYVDNYFKPEAKERMVKLVENLRASFAERIKGLEWMSEPTKEEALKKLARFTAKIGYPDEWKDYSALEISPDDLIGNYARSNEVEYNREISKLGKPIDRGEWFMTPQTVNAYYNPPMNEVVFPAAILQPPFFNMEADDAANYGAIGSVIGHELTHGFDDQGRKSDGDGNLRDWWTSEDEAQFKERAQVMIDQYNGYSPIEGMHVNGELTLGENIADLGGVTISYYAYKMSLNGKEAPVIEDLTGDQRFFLGWSQVWRRKFREEALRERILTDPHSPSQYRVNGIFTNMPEFYAAFNLVENDQLFRGETERVKIW